MAVNDDDACTIEFGSRNVVRVTKNFESNYNVAYRQMLRYKHVPSIRMLNLSCCLPVEISLKPNRELINKHGHFEMNFNNIIFNPTGYMTHDRAITDK